MPRPRRIKLETRVKNLPIPLHPGAEKYFKEKGLHEVTPSASARQRRSPRRPPDAACGRALHVPAT